MENTYWHLLSDTYTSNNRRAIIIAITVCLVSVIAPVAMMGSRFLSRLCIPLF